MKVISKSIPGYSRYLIYSDGKVWDYQKEVFLKQYLVGAGYLKSWLVNDANEPKYLYIHRLVAQVFLPNSENKPEVDHKDTHKDNNTVYINDDGTVNEELSNLCWVTHKQNCNNSLTKRHNSENHADVSGENNPMYGRRGELCPNYGKRGELSPNYGRHDSDETRAKKSAATSGENNPNYGNHLSDESKFKMNKNKKWYRNKITGHETTASVVTRMINQGKTTMNQWELIEN